MTMKVQSLRERQRQERERLILQAAMDIFTERGYHDMSMDEVAQRVGISKGTVYLHFPSKEEMLIAIITAFTRQVVGSIRDIVQNGKPPREQLEQIVQSIYLTGQEQKMRVFALINESDELRTTLRTRCGAFGELYQEIDEMLTSIFEKGKADGTFSTAIPTPVLITIFSTFMSPRHMLMIKVKHAYSNEEYARYISEVFFNGIARQP